MQNPDDDAHGVSVPDDSRALHRIYTQARHLVGCRIEIDAEIERRIASVVLFTYADALATPAPAAEEVMIVRLCVAKLMARTSQVPARTSAKPIAAS